MVETAQRLELCRYSSRVLLCFCDSVCSVCSVPMFELTSDIASATVGRCVLLLTLFPGATLCEECHKDAAPRFQISSQAVSKSGQAALVPPPSIVSAPDALAHTSSTLFHKALISMYVLVTSYRGSNYSRTLHFASRIALSGLGALPLGHAQVCECVSESLREVTCPSWLSQELSKTAITRRSQQLLRLPSLPVCTRHPNECLHMKSVLRSPYLSITAVRSLYSP
jgi:hypothetical protein